MRRRRMFIVLLLALVSGVAAAYLALNVLNQRESPIATTRANLSEVVVAARDLPLGSVLTAQDIKLVEWPGNTLPVGYSSSTEEVLGRGLITPVAENEPLLSTKMALAEAGGGLPIVIPEGQRAVSVQVDEVVAVAGFVLPGNRVDVLVTLDQATYSDNPITKLIMQNIAVLSAGQIIAQDANGTPQVVSTSTLLVTPEEAERLVLAATKGRIQFALRNTLDLDSLTTPGMRVTGLVPGGQPVRRTTTSRRSAPAPRRAPQIEVIRGADVETETVPGDSQ
ncbi:MAG: Flp pilus assembly protein CpaB [Gemmatimonadota bacterium]